MDLTSIEKSIIKMIRRKPYGSITIHIQGNKIIWVDDDKRLSPEALLQEYNADDTI